MLGFHYLQRLTIGTEENSCCGSRKVKCFESSIDSSGPIKRVLRETTKTGKKRYCYYVSQQDLKHGAGTSGTERVAAGEIETAVIQHFRGLLHQPDFVAETWRQARKTDPDISESDVLKALIAFDEVWDQLFPKEQAQVLRLIVRQVTIQHDRLDIILWPDMQALWDEIHEDPDFAAWA